MISTIITFDIITCFIVIFDNYLSGNKLKNSIKYIIKTDTSCKHSLINVVASIYKDN